MKINISFFFIVFFGVITIETEGQCFKTPKDFKEYFRKNIATLDPIEGLWSATVIKKMYFKDSLIRSQAESQVGEWAIIKNENGFTTCSPNGEISETKVDWTPTAIHGIYLYKKTYLSSGNTVKANAILTNGLLIEYQYEENDFELRKIAGDKYINGGRFINEFKFIKTFPLSDDYKAVSPSSGTGWAISSDGYIATNNHVIENAKTIKVRGINGDFSKVYNAKIIIQDKKNDLSIIKIDDLNFKKTKTVPYVITRKISDVGSSVFVLGYPLRSAMGDEVKLTNGIISSKSGFHGDITTYQITAAVQPGNSGGPLFDNRGNIIGIINAKLSGAENASYAIKASYLLNLIDLIPNPPILKKTSLLTGKAFTDQVNILRDFTYIIEINQ